LKKVRLVINKNYTEMHGQRNIKFYLKGTRDEAFYVVTDSTKHSPPKFNSSSDSRKYSKFTHTDADK